MAIRATFLTAFVCLLTLPAVMGKPVAPSCGRSTARAGLPPAPATKGLSIQALASRKKVYTGQPFTVSYRLYYQIPIIDPQNDISVKFKNCWVEEYPPVTAKNQEASLGKAPKSVELKKYLLIPQLPGTLPIPALTQHYRVTGSPDPNSFFGEEKIISTTVRSRPTSVAVMALPISQDSLPFCNAVGTFKFLPAYTVSKKSDNLLTFTLTVKGPGNLKNVRLMPPPLPMGVDMFNVEGHDRHVLTDSTLQATYVFSFNLVANHRGTYALPGMTVKYFDPYMGRYVIYAAPGYAWPVTNPQLPLLRPVGTPDRNRVKTPVLYTKTSLYQDQDLFVGSRLFYILAGLLASAGFATLAYYRYAEHQVANAAFYHFQDARKKAKQALKKNERQHHPHDLDAFTKGLHDILLTYISHKFFAPEKINSITGVSRYLQREQVPGKLREQAVATLQHLERLRFFSPPPAAASTQALGSVIGGLLDEFEHHCHAKSDKKHAFRGGQLAAVFLPGNK